MGQRREIPARADRASTRYHRQHIGIEKGDQRFDDLRPYAGVSAGEGIRAQQQHPAHHLAVERLTEPRGMTED